MAPKSISCENIKFKTLKSGYIRDKWLKENLYPDNKKLLRTPNTDNKGKLFVTLFAFAPAPKTNS
jgi:hypothetical protein